MIDLRLGDCLDLLPTLEAQSIDAVIADIPYGTTACKWDTVIPFEPMWEQLKRIAKPKAAIVLFGSQPFTSLLITSNLDMFRYQWVWEKSTPTRFLDANRRPLNAHEDIAVFSSNGHIYNPQKWKGAPNHAYKTRKPSQHQVYAAVRERLEQNLSGEKFPRTVIQFKSEHGLHSTQKPVALMEYLVKTYTNEGDTVLDFTMGSGTTMVACVNTKRNGIGFEILPKYLEIAQKRVAEAQRQMVLL